MPDDRPASGKARKFPMCCRFSWLFFFDLESLWRAKEFLGATGHWLVGWFLGATGNEKKTEKVGRDAPWKIHMEPKDGGLVQIIYIYIDIYFSFSNK